MALSALEDQYFVYENRLASFQAPQPVTKRRASNASSRAPKALTWPHKKLSPSSFAKAGFVFQPTPASPDNVVCFMCDKALDGWEEDDDPLVEHLKHVPDCGWAIVAAVEAELGEYAKLHPLDPQMIAARKATFAGRWPYDGKKAWKCKTKQLVDAGWYYSPTIESDDMATCAYCQLALDGWEAGDKPLDEHHKRCPDCPFFEMVNANPPPKKARATKAGRASKASRLSVQSVATTMSDLHSMADDLTLDADLSVMTTTSVATTGGSKKGRPKKATAAKTRKTKTKKDEAVEILEDAQDADMPPAPPSKLTKGRKRGSEAIEDSIVMNVEAPAPKKRAKKGTRTTEAVEDPISTGIEDQEVDMIEAPAPPAKQPVGRKKGRASTAKTTARKASATSLKAKASTASLRAQAAVDDELEQQLQADLERPLTDDEYMTADSESERTKPAAAAKRSTGKKAASSQMTNARSQQEQDDYAMFDPVPVEDDDAQVDEDLRTLEAEMEVEKEQQQQLVVSKKGRQAGTRKVSKQTKKAKDAEVPPPPPEHVEEPQEDSIVVTADREAAREPRQAVEDADTSSGTIVNNMSSAPAATQAKRGRGRPKKSSTSSQVAAAEAEPEAADNAVQPEADATEKRESISVVPTPPAKPAARTSASRADAMSTSTRGGLNKSLPPAPPSPPPHSEKPAPPTPTPATPPRVHHHPHHTTAPSASAKQATISPSQSPQSSDAENQPPSSKPASSAAAKRVALAPVSLPPTTPGRNNTAASPSRRNVMAGGWRSAQPWKPVDLDLVFGLVGEGGNENNSNDDAVVARLLKRGGGQLSTPERNMTVEEWIIYNAEMAEKMLGAECEAMVNKFEVEGGRALRVLEGLVVE